MSFYNMLFGMNGNTDILLAVLGLKRNDIQRLRDVFKSDDGSEIEILTRTGGGNRSDYPNMTMRKLPEWRGSSDDDFDCTYCTDTFAVPEQWRQDVANIDDFSKGIRPEFAQHLLATLNREPTDDDKESAAYDAESRGLKATRHFMANGHTFVPQDDQAMETALKLAEPNGGKLRSCWGILPLTIEIKQNFYRWPNARDENERKNMCRVEINYAMPWKIDSDYWTHCQERFTEKYPLAMELIAQSVGNYTDKARSVTV